MIVHTTVTSFVTLTTNPDVATTASFCRNNSDHFCVQQDIYLRVEDREVHFHRWYICQEISLLLWELQWIQGNNSCRWSSVSVDTENHVNIDFITMIGNCFTSLSDPQFDLVQNNAETLTNRKQKTRRNFIRLFMM